jgi:hypothetical protein
MKPRGFPPLVQLDCENILSSSKSAMLVDGTPVNEGFLQGDLLSPYLFLLIADVLQQMLITVNKHQTPS